VVIGQSIKYRASGFEEGEEELEWEWVLGSGDCDISENDWNLSVDSDWAEKGKDAMIPISKLPRANKSFTNNNYVNVSNGADLSCIDEDGAKFKANIFFNKDDISPYMTVPNWFYYWEQIELIQRELTIPGISLLNYREQTLVKSDLTLRIVYDESMLFDYGPYEITEYGASRSYPDLISGLAPFDRSGCQSINLPLRYSDEFNFIRIGKGCGFDKRRDICSSSSLDYNGIHTFFTTVIHEAEHVRLATEIWNFTDPSNQCIEPTYSIEYDMDRDGYKDLWESLSLEALEYNASLQDPSRGFMVRISSGGGPDIRDMYSRKYINDGQGSCDYCMGTCSNGTMYEEARCRQAEANLDVKDINSYDYSFDKSGDNQGKLWK